MDWIKDIENYAPYTQQEHKEKDLILLKKQE